MSTISSMHCLVLLHHQKSKSQSHNRLTQRWAKEITFHGHTMGPLSSLILCNLEFRVYHGMAAKAEFRVQFRSQNPHLIERLLLMRDESGSNNTARIGRLEGIQYTMQWKSHALLPKGLINMGWGFWDYGAPKTMDWRYLLYFGIERYRLSFSLGSVERNPEYNT